MDIGSDYDLSSLDMEEEVNLSLAAYQALSR